MYGRPCGQCGIFHLWKPCPAQFSECFKCGHMGHFSRMCFTRISRRNVTISAIQRDSTTATSISVKTEKVLQKAKKSKKKATRDRERKFEFESRRKLMSVLPFSKINNESVYIETVLKEEQAKLEEEIDELEHILEIERECHSDKEQKVKDLTRLIAGKDDRIQYLLKENAELRTELEQCRCVPEIATVSNRRHNVYGQSQRQQSWRGRGYIRPPTTSEFDQVYDPRPKCHKSCRNYEFCMRIPCTGRGKSKKGFPRQ
ncbi:hypothetical protein FSP39_009768 [Pinctada imbricata]|uniref:CCHC-type domain-containing protein n=1 Tax=Pinctada imbricata TaxID=66713 RepID=A0AA89C703_PINIB|nr:hypothetical protein FSP39_009768 [Pinctada imbricata]